MLELHQPDAVLQTTTLLLGQRAVKFLSRADVAFPGAAFFLSLSALHEWFQVLVPAVWPDQRVLSFVRHKFGAFCRTCTDHLRFTKPGHRSLCVEGAQIIPIKCAYTAYAKKSGS